MGKEIPGSQGPERERLLVVDDEPTICEFAHALFHAEGFIVETAGTGMEALKKAEAGRYDAVILDLGLPDIQGFTLLRKFNRLDPDMPVVIFTALGDVSMAVRAIKDGAYDFVMKLANPKDLIRVVRRAVAERNRRHASGGWRERLAAMFGNSDAMQRVYEALQRAAASRLNVLLAGESGTGRSFMGEQVHRLSGRSGGPFFSLSCEGLSADDLERRLFGQLGGVRPGPETERIGILEMAQEGSVLLDRVEHLAPQTQNALLDVLQQGEVRPIGGLVASRLDVRILSTGPSESSGTESSLRDDLRYRLAGVVLEVPPLRERSEDIETLAPWIVENLSSSHGRSIPRLSKEGLRLLTRQEWRGNIPELKKVLETALLSVKGKEITLDAIASAVEASAPS